MRVLQKLPDPDPGYTKYLIWAFGILFFYGGVLLFSPRVELHFSRDRDFAEKALRESTVVKSHFEFVSDVRSISNPARGRRGFGEHAWNASDAGGYFTFLVSGYKSLKDEFEDSVRYRVHFVRSSVGSKVTWVEENAPWLNYGEEPNPESCVRPERSGAVNTTHVEQAREDRRR